MCWAVVTRVTFILQTLYFAFVISHPPGKGIGRLSQLSYDDNKHLSRNYMVYEKACINDELMIWNKNVDSTLIESVLIKKAVANIFRSSNRSKCVAVCLRMGTPYDLVTYPLPHLIYNRNADSNIIDWIDHCTSAEFGIVSPDIDRSADLHVVHKDGRRTHMFTFHYGRDDVVWANVPLGREYEITDTASQAVLGKIHIYYSRVFVLSIDDFWSERDTNMFHPDINSTLRNSWNSSHSVRRTFTRTGFEITSLSKDLWGAICTYHYNNRYHFVPEEGNFIIPNWKDSPSFVLNMPPGLLAYLRSRLQGFMEDWIGGVPLDANSIIYGVRRYTRGARLLPHVDHRSTHAVAMIINVDQAPHMPEPWKLQIFDFCHRMHEVVLHPGEVLLYEVCGGGGGRSDSVHAP